GALFQTELEQQCHEDERCGNQEQAEPEKQTAEILRIVCRRQGTVPRGIEGKADGGWIEVRSEVVVNLVARNCSGPANGGEGTEAIGPQLLSGFCGDECFWRAAMLLPVSFVLVANFVFE